MALIHRMEPQRMVSLLLGESPEGHGFVYRSRIDLEQDRFGDRLVDESSGWWVEMAIDREIQAQNLREYLAVGLDDPGDKELSVTVSTSSGLTFSSRVPGTLAGYRELARQMIEVGPGTELAEEAPGGFLPVLSFLDRSIARDLFEGTGIAVDRPLGGEWRPLVEILLAVLRTESTRESGPEPDAETIASRGGVQVWKVGTVEKAVGPGFDSPKLHEILAPWRQRLEEEGLAEKTEQPNQP